MKEIQITNIPLNSYFSGQVFLDQKYILLSPDTEFSQQIRSRLARWGYTTLFTKSDSVNVPAGNKREAVENDAPKKNVDTYIKDQGAQGEAKKFCSSLLDFTEHVFTDFVTRNELPAQRITEKIKEITNFVKNNKKYILRLSVLDSPDLNYIVSHSVKTTVLSISIALSLRLPAHKIIEVGTAALLHEIGMIKLPPQLYLSDRVLTPQEKKAIYAHAVLGFKILKSLSFPLSVCTAVLDHHEHMDGSGYPRGITSEKISLYARIIAVCDAYAASTSTRPFRQSKNGHAGLLDMLKDRGKYYDEKILRTLIMNISIFPLGTYVQLSDGSKGVVYDTNEENPRTPAVQVLADPAGKLIQGTSIVKSEEKNYQIVRPLSKEEIEKISLKS